MNTKENQKYNPCRKFRKGDMVRMVEWKGRKPYDFWHKQTIEHFGAKLDTVLENELDSGNVDIFQDAPIDELTVRVHASHLELVIPVEVLNPFKVECDYDDKEYSITYRNKFVSVYPYDADSWYTEEQAKAAAEAECDRLNAEYRKSLININNPQ